ncbi:YehR family lipoprotein [Kosakonia sacchari]|uniref:YehR family lipoprotein n=1 Tax=Kosakonia sacchari TaxID=1158459 RepID=UPI00080750DA|nr:YehR family lipoprotein [Kosakonia sacchari]
MKLSKFIAVLFSVALLIGLSGCGEKEQSKTFTFAQAGTEVTLTYYYKGDQVERQTAKNKIEYSSIGAKNKEEAMKVLDPISKKYQSIKGIKESVDYQETYAQETLDVDYNEVDFAALNNLQGSEFTGTVNGKISMKKSEELLKSRGFKEVQ